MRVRIQDIIIGERHRKDLGDIAGLAASIDKVGLLQPVVLTADHRLVAGRRRIAAYEEQGHDTIEAVVATTPTDAAHLLKAECDENTCRKDFTPSESVAIGEAIVKIYKPQAEAAQRAGGGDKKSKVAKSVGVNCPKRSKRDESARTNELAAKAVHTSRRTYEKRKAVVESGDAELIAEMDRTGRTNGVYNKLKIRKAVAEIEAEPPALPSGPFRVIVADPPWEYEKRAGDPSHRSANPYPSMSLADICELDVAGIAHDDATLWLWTTNAFMEDAYAVARAWGFSPKTVLTWCKNKMGTGDWLRGQTEHCLLCVRGRPVVNLTNQTTLLEAPVGRHSEKPEAFYTLVETLCPGSKVELFSRNPRDGWSAHGNENEQPEMEVAAC